MSVQSDLQGILEAYTAALLADAANPQPSYTIATAGGGSRTVDRNAWRQQLMESINELQLLINRQTPYFISTRTRL